MLRILALALWGAVALLAWAPWPAADARAVLQPESVDTLAAPSAAQLLARDLDRLGAPLAAAMPTPTAQWTSGRCTVKPGSCDAAMDVGSGYVVYLSGGGPLYIYNTSGTLMQRLAHVAGRSRKCYTMTGGATIAQEGETDDQSVVYDRQAQRWFINWSIPGCIAVSQTSDPRGPWWVYYTNHPTDAPACALWTDAYYCPNNGGPALWAVERSAMLAGQPAHWLGHTLFDTDINPTAHGWQGIGVASATGAAAPPGGAAALVLAPTDVDPTGAGAVTATTLNLYTWTLNWTTGAETLSSPTALTVASYKNVTEPGVYVAGFMGNRVVYQNRGSYQQIVAAQRVRGPSSQRTFAWYDLRNSGSGWTVNQQGQYTPDTQDRIFPTIATDAAGNIAAAFYHCAGTYSGGGVCPADTLGVSYVGRLSGDTAGTLPQTEITLGTTADWADRDVLVTSGDDDCAFWLAYGHQIASFRFTACP